MSRKDRFYIIIKYHYNPTSNIEAKQKALPVLVLDSDGDPLEFDSQESADEFVSICNINSNQGFSYAVKELGKKYLKVNQKKV